MWEDFSNCGNPPTGLAVEGYLLSALPATEGINPSLLKGNLGRDHSIHCDLPQYYLDSLFYVGSESISSRISVGLSS